MRGLRAIIVYFVIGMIAAYVVRSCVDTAANVQSKTVSRTAVLDEI